MLASAFHTFRKLAPPACTVPRLHLHHTCMTAGSETSVSAATTSTTASGTTAFFMHAMLKPYTSSQNAMRSWCLTASPTAARLMLQRSGYTLGEEREGTWDQIDAEISIPPTADLCAPKSSLSSKILIPLRTCCVTSRMCFVGTKF